MKSIIIFNYNYTEFLNKALDSCSGIFNNGDYNIFLLDDGSSDNSIEHFNSYVLKKSVTNLNLIKNREINAKKRKLPSHGQIEGLKKIIDKNPEKIGEYIFLLDADDFFNFNILKFDEMHLKKNLYDIIFLKVDDLISQKNVLKSHKIKRNAEQGGRLMWPSIVPTSGIVLKKSFITSNYNYIFNLNIDHADVWLDARLNILALAMGTKILYSDLQVIRLIHSENDSLKGGLTRFFLKQLITLRYRETIAHLRSCKITMRYIATKFLLVIFQTFKK
jgi:hypothetical protein